METAQALPAGGRIAANGLAVAKPTKRSVQIERAQDSAIAVLTAVSSYLDADEELPSFFGRLSEAIAQQTNAARAAFWRLGPRATVFLQPAPFGFGDESPIHGIRFQLGANREGAMERVVYGDDSDLVKGTSPALDGIWRECGLSDVTNSIAASWRAGERRIGAISVFDSRQGFSPQDLWLLRVAGMAAGLLWQYREAEDDLEQTAVRLEEAMTARRHLLNNIAAGGDEARRRFASALHDDSLQLLTGAELQLERMRTGENRGEQLGRIDELHNTLHKVEGSLRRLLINVSPEPLQLPNDLREAIRERLEQLRLRAGIESHIDYRLSDDIPPAIQAIVIKNVGEALNNVEKHARATRVTLVAEVVDGGIRIELSDDGTGFVVAESIRVPGHIGLVALRERAQLAGGWCRIDSDPGAGTKIEFWVPMTL